RRRGEEPTPHRPAAQELTEKALARHAYHHRIPERRYVVEMSEERAAVRRRLAEADAGIDQDRVRRHAGGSGRRGPLGEERPPPGGHVRLRTGAVDGGG